MEEMREKMARYNREHLLEPEFDGTNDVLWRRDESGFHTNVRQRVMHHSPEGFEIGYAGSGPADFALNIAAALFPALEGEESEKCFYGKVSREAWLLHQKFKFKFLAAADRNAGKIRREEIEGFLGASSDEDRAA